MHYASWPNKIVILALLTEGIEPGKVESFSALTFKSNRNPAHNSSYGCESEILPVSKHEDVESKHEDLEAVELHEGNNVRRFDGYLSRPRRCL